MSSAFLKEEAFDVDLSPPRPQSPWTNYVTPRGLEQIETRIRELEAQLAMVPSESLQEETVRSALERQLAFWLERLNRAVLVAPQQQSYEVVRFGARVALCNEIGDRFVFDIVGEDEAEPAQGRISWVSPLAKALLGAREGESVLWVKPKGPESLEILSIQGISD